MTALAVPLPENPDHLTIYLFVAKNRSPVTLVWVGYDTQHHHAALYRVDPAGLRPVDFAAYQWMTPPPIPTAPDGTRIVCHQTLKQPELLPRLHDHNLALVTDHATTYLHLPVPADQRIYAVAVSPDGLTAVALAHQRPGHPHAATVVVFDL